MKKLLLFLIIPALLFSCTDQNETADCIEVQPDAVFVLPTGACAEWQSEGLSLEILSIQDSRCPMEVLCIWEGKADVELRIWKDGEKYTSIVSVRGLCESDCGSSADVLDYTIEIMSLHPYPETGGVPFEDYEAELLVRYKD